MGKNLKRPELAGRWYPASQRECRSDFDSYERDAVGSDIDTPRAAVVPHAGWVFSGSIAYNALRELSRGKADVIVLFGGHKGPRSAISIFDGAGFSTPFGPLETDLELVSALLKHYPDMVVETVEANTQDNAVEVVLPMLKALLPDAAIVVIGAPPRPQVVALGNAVADVARALGRRLALVASTDLTHYGPNYGFAPRGTGSEAERWVREHNDPAFIEAALEMDGAAILEQALTRHNACCPGAVAAAVAAATRLGSQRGQRLRYATSADVHRSASFVGYSALVF